MKRFPGFPGFRIRPVLATTLVVFLVPVAAASYASRGNEPARHAASRTVIVDDNTYSRAALTIHKNDSVVFDWGAPKNEHNVTADSGPAKFHSETTSSDTYRYVHKFRKTGTYSLLCTRHPSQMRMTVKVKRR
ncbi:MAG: hypothetical protein HY827_10015 [Actinobacteria bacterium]|nr:hypothetical protein [Actinomycetota bacterium]